MKYIKFFDEINNKDINLVGGKNASLGQMYSSLDKLNINIPFGFAITAQAYYYILETNNLKNKIKNLIDKIDKNNLKLLDSTGNKIRNLILNSEFPKDLILEINNSYNKLSKFYNKKNIDVAVRSSATAEDLPTASFAGQQETYLNISGISDLLESVKKCLASLFTNRAIIYRIEKKIDQFNIGISVGVQKMVRSDKACSGVAFTLDTETGFKDIVIINSSYGLGEGIVKGIVNPDEFQVYKKKLVNNYNPILKKYLGTKESQFIYDKKSKIKNIKVSKNKQIKFSLEDKEILDLTNQAIKIEKYYTDLNNRWSPMDIEWAKDGLDNKIYIVQARPETVYSQENNKYLTNYNLINSKNLEILATGQSIGNKIANGKARVIKNIKDVKDFNSGDILVTTMTDPDWVPIIKKAGAIITDQGGRTCHAAIVARELGIPAIIGTINGTKKIKDKSDITIDCSKGSTGYIYKNFIKYNISKTEIKSLPKAPVPILLNIGDPDQAYKFSFLPAYGVGLARLEFIINNSIQIHPLAITEFNKIKDQKIKQEIKIKSAGYHNPKDFYIEKLSQSIATIAAAFYPKPVIIRLTDFKSNEYSNLIGGKLFEPIEENPMLGFRGAVRYCSKEYSPAFALECEALKIAIYKMGFDNIKIMVPFVRTISEAECTLNKLAQNGLSKQNNKDNKLEFIMMCEIPSNIILLEEFAQYFDGFSIGSNDLTQLTLGVDRDSGLLGNLFNEKDPAVKKFLLEAVSKAKKLNKPIGICGQAPSDFPEIANLLINAGISSLSLNPDSVIPFLLNLKK